MGNLLLAVVFAVLYVIYRRRDRRLLRNGVFFVAAAWFALNALLQLLAAYLPGFRWVLVAILFLLPLAVLVLAGFLIANGITVVRAEGASLGTLLSLLAGLALVALPVVAVLLVAYAGVWGLGIAAVLFFVTSYLGVAFTVFLVYSLVYRRVSQDVEPAALVVLGSRIIDGRVPPLLRSRLDRALTIYRSERAAGRAPLLIPSGGQGEDESRSEGEAMAEYLLAQGADPADVVPETRARSTRENLLYARELQAEAGRPGPALAVTNDYHVLRAAILARQIGTDTQVVGSPTARYYVPSAFLREFVAVMVEHKVLNLVLTLPFVAATVFFVIAASRTF